MKLYRIDCGDGYHYARNMDHLARAIKHIDEEYRPAEDLIISVVEFDISRRGILSALWEGANAAGGHVHSEVMIFGDSH